MAILRQLARSGGCPLFHLEVTLSLHPVWRAKRIWLPRSAHCSSRKRINRADGVLVAMIEKLTIAEPPGREEISRKDAKPRAQRGERGGFTQRRREADEGKGKDSGNSSRQPPVPAPVPSEPAACCLQPPAFCTRTQAVDRITGFTGFLQIDPVDPVHPVKEPSPSS